MVELMLGDRFAAPRALEALPHAAQNEQIDAGNGEQEERRGASANNAADHLERMKPALERECRADDHRNCDSDDERVAKRKKQSGRDRPFAFLHQLTHDVVDCGDVVGIDGMTQPEHIGKERGAEKCRMGRKRDKGPGPDRGVERKKQEINSRDLAPLIRRCIVQCRGQMADHKRSSRNLPSARARTKRLTSFRSSTGAPRPVFVASTRTMAGLLARGSSLRLAFPAQTLRQWLNRTKLPAHSCGGSCGFGCTDARPHRIPYSPSSRDHRCPSDRFRCVALSIWLGCVRAEVPASVPLGSVAKLSLVLGGARSGKSRYAESLVSALPPPWQA